MLVKYIREKTKEDIEKGYKGKPTGVIVAINKDHIGWSLCNSKDNFNRNLGKDIAIGRAKKYKITEIEFENIDFSTNIAIRYTHKRIGCINKKVYEEIHKMIELANKWEFK